MKIALTVLPPNSMLLVMDPSSDGIPRTFGGRSVAATPSVVAIGTLAVVSGPTDVLLTDEPDALRLRGVPVFSGTIKTPQQTVAVVTSQNAVLLECKVTGTSAHLDIRSNDANEPDVIDVFVRSVD